MCTLQLNFRCPPTETQQLFSNFRYYKVHTLNISRPCPRSDILRACPNTKYLSLYKDRSLCFEARKVFAKKCAKKIERLGLQTGLESYLSCTLAASRVVCIFNIFQTLLITFLVWVTSPWTTNVWGRLVYDFIDRYFSLHLIPMFSRKSSIASHRCVYIQFDFDWTLGLQACVHLLQKNVEGGLSWRRKFLPNVHGKLRWKRR